MICEAQVWRLHHAAAITGRYEQRVEQTGGEQSAFDGPRRLAGREKSVQVFPKNREMKEGTLFLCPEYG
jgi:hypothetical protein